MHSLGMGIQQYTVGFCGVVWTQPHQAPQLAIGLHEQIHCTPSLSPCQRSCGPSTQGILETQLSSRYTYADATRTPLTPGSLSTPPLSLQATKRRRTEAQPVRLTTAVGAHQPGSCFCSSSVSHRRCTSASASPPRSPAALAAESPSAVWLPSPGQTGRRWPGASQPD